MEKRPVKAVGNSLHITKPDHGRQSAARRIRESMPMDNFGKVTLFFNHSSLRYPGIWAILCYH